MNNEYLFWHSIIEKGAGGVTIGSSGIGSRGMLPWRCG